jgi:ferredoxin-NADP reductase
MEDFKSKIARITAHCSDAKTFRLDLQREVSYKPGQYLIFTIDIKGAAVSKPLSISSSPTEKGYIEFTKKITGSDFSQTLDAAKVGDECSVRMPLGKFIFDGQFEEAAFLSGGIGITPIRSMLKYATDMKIRSNLVLLYSGRAPEYLIFKDDFEIMQKTNKYLKVIYTLTDCEQRAERCRTGRIDAGMIREEIPDYKKRKFFICGPPGMVGAMRSILTDQLIVQTNNIITEDFFGY